MALVRTTSGEALDFLLIPIEIAFGAAALLFLRRVSWTWLPMLIISIAGVLFFAISGVESLRLWFDEELFMMLEPGDRFRHKLMDALWISEAGSSLVIAVSLMFSKPVRAWFHAKDPAI